MFCTVLPGEDYVVAVCNFLKRTIEENDKVLLVVPDRKSFAPVLSCLRVHHGIKFDKSAVDILFFRPKKDAFSELKILIPAYFALRKMKKSFLAGDKKIKLANDFLKLLEHSQIVDFQNLQNEIRNNAIPKYNEITQMVYEILNSIQDFSDYKMEFNLDAYDDYKIIFFGSTYNCRYERNELKNVMNKRDYVVFLPRHNPSLLDASRLCIINTFEGNFLPVQNILLLLQEFKLSSSDIRIVDGKGDVCDQGQEEDILYDFSKILFSKRNLHIKDSPCTTLPNCNIIKTSSFYDEARCIFEIIKNALAKKETVAVINSNMYVRNYLDVHLKNIDGCKYCSEESFLFEVADVALVTNTIEFICGINSAIGAHSLLSILKNRYVTFGYEEDHYSELLTCLEMNIVRSASGRKSWNKFKEKASCVQNLCEFVHKIDYAFKPLMELLEKNENISCLEILDAHLETINRLLFPSDITKISKNIESVFDVLKKICSYGNYTFASLFEYRTVIKFLCSNLKIENEFDEQVDVAFLSQNFKILDCYDVVVISDFAEGKWDSYLTPNLALNDDTRKLLNIAPSTLERSRIEYFLYLCLYKKECYITYSSVDTDGNIQFEHKWSMYIRIIYEMHGAECFHDYVTSKESRQVENYNIIQPEPKVDGKRLPRKFSATMIEALIRDPYALYAKYVMNLYKPLAIDQELLPGTFGTIVHNIFEKYAGNYERFEVDCNEAMKEYARQEFMKYKNLFELQTIWKRKFLNAARDFISLDRQRRENIQEIMLERRFAWAIDDLGITVEAICDRVELLDDGTIAIIDYKTSSTLPTGIDVKSGFSPQLLIQAIVAENELKRPVSHLSYWHITSAGISEKIPIKKDLESYIIDAKKGLYDLLRTLLNGDLRLSAVPNYDKKSAYNDYSCMEREEEWRKFG